MFASKPKESPTPVGTKSEGSTASLPKAQTSQSAAAPRPESSTPTAVKAQAPRPPQSPVSPKTESPTPTAAKPQAPRPAHPPVAPKPADSKPAAAGLEELERLEAKIEAYETAWAPAGRALDQVHQQKLYLLHATSFETYLGQRWNMKLRHAMKMILGAKVAKNVRKVSESLSLRNALQLAKLPKEQQADCLREVIGAGSPRRAIAADLAAAVAKRVPGKKRRKRKSQKLSLKLPHGTITLKRGGDLADLKALIAEATERLSRLLAEQAAKPKAA